VLPSTSLEIHYSPIVLSKDYELFTASLNEQIRYDKTPLSSVSDCHKLSDVNIIFPPLLNSSA
jgi:hypothetical protein